ncbi:hypothetical protein BKA62DRAFT_705027 [Auriculariales sp. MPI-PUGE-AT-0066]|nr:hypothetical protein BKA62DRAFT_705027 [Auriculariales sp. MPI-PUGE-AT-0066]
MSITAASQGCALILSFLLSLSPFSLSLSRFSPFRAALERWAEPVAQASLKRRRHIRIRTQAIMVGRRRRSAKVGRHSATVSCCQPCPPPSSPSPCSYSASESRSCIAPTKITEA